MLMIFSVDEFLHHVLSCSEISEGKIKTVALTNFDTERLQIILENGIPIVSNQVYYCLVTNLMYAVFPFLINVDDHMVLGYNNKRCL